MWGSRLQASGRSSCQARPVPLIIPSHSAPWGTSFRCSRRAIASRPWPKHVSRQDEKADFGRLFFCNAGGWYRDWLPGLALDSRDVLEAFKAAVEAGEVSRLHDGSEAKPAS
jgi:hypothetical protein